jgi:nucleotide-sensitive chloride channel 1A
MALRHITTSPKTEDYTPLQEHQEQTPTTFFGSKAVLYAHYSDLTLSAPASKLSIDSAFSAFKTTPEEGSEDALIKDVEIWVASR